MGGQRPGSVEGWHVSAASDEEARLRALIQERLGVTVDGAHRLASLGLDSLALMDFVAGLEKEFRFRADQDLFDVETVAELAEYIREHGD
jgi:acyl carrier protein